MVTDFGVCVIDKTGEILDEGRVVWRIAPVGIKSASVFGDITVAKDMSNVFLIFVAKGAESGYRNRGLGGEVVESR